MHTLRRKRTKGGIFERPVRVVRNACRHAPARARALPHFVILGTQKGGTTAFFKDLTIHPGVVPPTIKEIDFFSDLWDQGVDWYRSHFPMVARLFGRLTGEASPSYLHHPRAAERMHAVIPDARLIVLLRNPVDRTFSHYRMKVDRGIETLSFEDAIDAEEERLAGEAERMAADEHYVSHAWRHYSYLTRGRYVEQIEAIDRYYPREALLVLKSEDLFHAARGGLRRAAHFLGLDGLGVDPMRRSNRGPRTVPDAAMRRRLEDYFAPFNRRLYERLGVDLGW